MAAFQIGIMAGSFAGGLLYERSVLAMLIASAVLIGAGAAGMTAERQLFDVPATGYR
jgi:predicted MFS family arabinose efflux permease